MIVKAQVSFVTECNAKSVVVGSSFQLTFRLNNAQGINFTPPSFDGFDLINGPMRSMQSSFVNGVGTSSMGYVYTLQAVKEGILKVGSASIVVHGKVLKSNPIT
ncbi:MAG TPA: BatD family protein, partial [Saprospiraceae bacterium]|nr:BatD family protein [Saprospiraceae bacterium]